MQIHFSIIDISTGVDTESLRTDTWLKIMDVK